MAPVYAHPSPVAQPSSGSSSRLGNLVASSSSRQQLRLGVTTDYTDLSLHSACANANIGTSLVCALGL